MVIGCTCYLYKSLSSMNLTAIASTLSTAPFPSLCMLCSASSACLARRSCSCCSPQRLLQGENDGVGGLVRVPVQVLLLPGDGGNVSAGGIVAGFGSGLVPGPEGQARPTQHRQADAHSGSNQRRALEGPGRSGLRENIEISSVSRRNQLNQRIWRSSVYSEPDGK